ncbi:MAG: hypothetical protein DRR19_29820 [Candidatus Parabeggiatoa sp. nov. 1]|nr:MAG: hypothetical protein DRR19_29820 [Gammaproteobacteria bacterium]
MVKVESLQYDTIFKKAFCHVDLFTGLVKDFTDIHLEIDEVEHEKVFEPPIGHVRARFDLFAEDKKNRVIVEAQHASNTDDFDRFFYYHIIAMAETIRRLKNYCFPKVVITLVFFTEKKTPKPDRNILIQDSEIRDLAGNVVEKVHGFKHRLIFIFTGDPLSDWNVPKPCFEWIEAINDTLDEEADENEYDNPLIKQLFQIISKDKTTPEEYAHMKEEYNQRQILVNGQKKIRLEAARECLLLSDKLTEQEMAKITGLTVDDIRALSTQ